MKKDLVQGGLDSLLNPQPLKIERKAEPTVTETKERNKLASYSIPASYIDNVTYIANYDRKTKGGVVAEALAMYFEHWNTLDHKQEKPRKL